MVFDIYCANDRAISLGPKRSTERMFSKYSCFHGDKSFWPTFPRLIDCNKPQVYRLKGWTSYSDKNSGFFRSLFPGPKRLMKTQSFNRKSKIQVKTSYLTNFSQILEYDKRHVTIYKGLRDILTIIVQLL